MNFANENINPPLHSDTTEKNEDGTPKTQEQIESEKELADAQKELAWELSKSAVDVAGIVDPTPISDVVGAAMSLSDGDLIGTGLSLISIIPYAGDALAKTAKGSRAAAKIAKLGEKIAAKTAKLKAIAKKASTPVQKAIENAEKKLTKSAASNSIKKCPLVKASKKVLKKYEAEQKRIAKWLANPENEKIWKANEDKARAFYKKQNPNMPDHEITSHLNGIDFTKPINIKEIPPPNEIYQFKKYTLDNEGNKIYREGPYYSTNKNSTPSELGISEKFELRSIDGKGIGELGSQDKIVIDITKNEPVEVLESTSRSVKDTWNVPGQSIPTEGGANQLYTPQMSAK